LITYRFASQDDIRRIVNKLKSQDIAIPNLNEDTIVAVSEHDYPIAFASVRMIPFAYFHFDEDLRGHRVGWRLPAMVENMLKSRGFKDYFTGVDERVPIMVKVAERHGFHSWGERLYHKLLDPIIKGWKDDR
jgi:GNAT superfamily N-acetyltransferase